MLKFDSFKLKLSVKFVSSISSFDILLLLKYDPNDILNHLTTKLVEFDFCLIISQSSDTFDPITIFSDFILGSFM
jgi:hypothetical protein